MKIQNLKIVLKSLPNLPQQAPRGRVEAPQLLPQVPGPLELLEFLPDPICRLPIPTQIERHLATSPSKVQSKIRPAFLSKLGGHESLPPKRVKIASFQRQINKLRERAASRPATAGRASCASQ